MITLQEAYLRHAQYGFTEYRHISGIGDFVGINPRLTATGTTNADVARITCIVLDIDGPNHAPVGLDVWEYCQKIVNGENIESYVFVSSGRGAHIYIPVDLPTNIDVNTYIKKISIKYADPRYRIDLTGDLARVIRKWGSINPKNGAECKVVLDKYYGINPMNATDFRVQEDERPKILVGDIQNGGRNTALTSLAGSMRNKGFTADAIEAALLAENAARCVPPLPETEVKAIVKSVSRYAPAPAKEDKTKSLNDYSQKYLEGLLSRKSGYSTGFKKLDDMLVGLQGGRLYVVVARTNEGKTSFACNIARSLLSQNISVMYFPTEIGHEPLFDKILSQTTEIPLKKFQFGDFSDEEKQKIKTAMETIQAQPFMVAEDFSLVLNVFVREANERKPQVIVLDFIGAMHYAEGGTPSEISHNVRGIKQVAAELNIPVIMCAQFNRGAIQNEVSLQYIKGSGAIEEFADVVMALSTVNSNVYPRIVDLHILKNRYSEVGKIRLDFYSTTGKFQEHV